MGGEDDGGEIVGFIDELAEWDHENPEHTVTISIHNKTDMELTRCTYGIAGHIWKCEGFPNGAPPEKLGPGQFFKSMAVCNVVGAGTWDIDYNLAYCKTGEESRPGSNIIWVRIKCPRVGRNEYFDSGVQARGKELGVTALEEGDFRQNREGRLSMECRASWTLFR